MKHIELAPGWADAYTAECRTKLNEEGRSFEGDHKPPPGWWYTKRQFAASLRAKHEAVTKQASRAGLKGAYAAGATNRFKAALAKTEEDT